MKYWLIIASKDHVESGKAGGFCQACHGKLWPMEKMHPGDGVLFYSSKEVYGSSKPYQKFTAAGRIKDDEMYQARMGKDFYPFRRKVKYFAAVDIDIHPLLDDLHFIDDPHSWGYKLRRGFLEIDGHDFDLVSGIMRKRS